MRSKQTCLESAEANEALLQLVFPLTMFLLWKRRAIVAKGVAVVRAPRPSTRICGRGGLGWQAESKGPHTLSKLGSVAHVGIFLEKI